MINNYICEKCNHTLVCKKVDILFKFSDSNNKNIGVDVEMLSCSDFSPIEGTENS